MKEANCRTPKSKWVQFKGVTGRENVCSKIKNGVKGTIAYRIEKRVEDEGEV